jgi:RNA polymerase subunit RPABC4/transcription elongation factor Spt4
MDLVVETVDTCPFCGGVLELMEDATFVWFGCRRCMRYVKREKREIVRRFVNYRERRFNWSGMITELYQIYTGL